MLSIGVTGGLGCGKSAAMRMFYKLGANTLNADDIAKNLIQVNPALVAKIKETFGEECYLDGELQTSVLAARAFDNPGTLDQLNAIVHPVLREYLHKYIVATRAIDGVLMIEAAILLEAGYQDLFEKVLLITADDPIRIRRAVANGILDEKNIRRRMMFQMPESEKRKFADHIIENNGDENELKAKCKSYWEEITRRDP